jgi:hypothetical protein
VRAQENIHLLDPFLAGPLGLDQRDGSFRGEHHLFRDAPHGQFGDPAAGTNSLSWDPVTRYRNGNPIEAGKKVYYDVYWTTDPGLSAGTLTPLSSSVESTSITFDPSASGMKRNQRVYFTGKSKLSTGEKSALSSGISWRVSNSGPTAPSNGRVVRKKK